SRRARRLFAGRSCAAAHAAAQTPVAGASGTQSDSAWRVAAMTAGASGSEPFSRAELADAVLDTASDAIIACDADGIIRFWNAGAARIFGFTAEEAKGRSLDIIIPERLRERHWTGYSAMMQSGQSRYGVGHLLAVPGLRKDGSQVSLEFTLMALK